MTDERTEEILFDINGKLSSIGTKLDTLSETILKHESRITTIENNFNNHIIETKSIKPDDDFKTQILKLLSKALIISLCALGALTGSAGLITKLLNI